MSNTTKGVPHLPEPSEAPGLAEALYDIETYFRLNGCTEFVYDEELDVFRFPEDHRFAFCREFADWELLEERGYLAGL
jgi:hypothetical protein